MRLSVIALKFRTLSFEDLAALGNAVIAGFTAQVILYPAPVPVLATVSTNVAALIAAITAHGTRSNHGRSTDYLVLKDAADVVRRDLFTLASYAESVTPGDRTNLALLGYTLRQIPRRSVGILQQVRNLRQMISPRVPIGQIKIKWQKPLDTVGVNINGYRIKRGTTADFAAATEIAIVTKGVFIDLAPPSPGVNLFYFVQAFNASGYGVYEVCIASATAP